MTGSISLARLDEGVFEIGESVETVRYAVGRPLKCGCIHQSVPLLLDLPRILQRGITFRWDIAEKQVVGGRSEEEKQNG